jgi:hypothetical protein
MPNDAKLGLIVGVVVVIAVAVVFFRKDPGLSQPGADGKGSIAVKSASPSQPPGKAPPRSVNRSVPGRKTSQLREDEDGQRQTSAEEEAPVSSEPAPETTPARSVSEEGQ